MKDIFLSTIKRGNYNLEALLRRIDAYHIEGKLTDGERDSLYAEARQASSPLYDCTAEITALWQAVKAIEKKLASTSDIEISKWQQPLGAHDAYMKGDRASFGDIVFESLIDGNVWSPDVHPDAWAAIGIGEGE